MRELKLFDPDTDALVCHIKGDKVVFCITDGAREEMQNLLDTGHAYYDMADDQVWHPPGHENLLDGIAYSMNRQFRFRFELT